MEYAEFQLEVDQQQAGVIEQLAQHFVDLQATAFHFGQLLGGAPAERDNVGLVDEGSPFSSFSGTARRWRAPA